MSRTPLYTDDLRLAHILADSVDRVSSARFRDRPVYSPTDGGTAVREEEQKLAEPAPLAPWQRAAQQNAAPEPVAPEAPADYALEAALEVEELLRAQLSRVRTRDGIAGEHSGYNGQAARQWVIAPLAELETSGVAFPCGRRSSPCWTRVSRWWAWSPPRRWAAAGGRPAVRVRTRASRSRRRPAFRFLR